ncbi:MAG: pitrilysin family protein [Bacteroidetes bacterium]|nr:pitrilysin family protein [Bacteroidota bacterium]
MKRILLVISLFSIHCSVFNQQSFAQQPAAPAQSQLIEKVVPNSSPTEPASSSGKLIIPYEKWKLPNGLTLIIHEDHSDPVVNVRISYHVGSARESIGKSGFAHFFEHMMFEGSDHLKDKEHFAIVNKAGGNMNGNTERDVTNYFETLPSNYLEVALWLEADRMGFLLDSVTKEKFEIQRETVKNEKSQNFENVPYALAFEEVLNQALYPKGHPYSWPTIGYTDDLNRVTVDDLKNFFLRWYGPNNAVLSVSGDVNSKEVLALTEKYFGSIPSCPEVKKLRVPAPILANDQYANYIDNVYFPLILMVYPTVPSYHKDEAALDIMASMMGEGNNSIFYKEFVKTEKAIEASTSHSTGELAGEYAIQVVSFPDQEFDEQPTSQEDYKKKLHALVEKNFNETEKKIHATIDEFEKSGITDEALQRSKAKIESQIIDQGTSVYEKGVLLTRWNTLLGKQFNLSDEYERYDTVTTKDIIRVFNKYIKNKHAAIVNVYPKDPESKDSVKSFNPYANAPVTIDPQYTGLKYVKAKDNFDRSKKPAEGAPKAPVVPDYYTSQLKNGIKVIGTQAVEAPKIFIQIVMEGGDLVHGTDVKKVGLSQLTAAMMDEGTKNYTTEQISAELEKLGSDISINGGARSTVISVNCLSKNVDATLKLLEEKLFRPRFDPSDFKRIKKQLLESIENEKKIAQATATKLFSNLMFGNTVFGSYISYKNFKKLSLDDVKNYYQQYYSPSVAQIVIVGDISEKEIMPKLEFLNKWEGKEVKLPEFAGFAPIQQTQIYLAHKDDAAQSIITIGNPGLAYNPTGDYFKCNAMNYSLGGSFNGRLNLDIRENKAWTYGIYSGFNGSKYPGTFQVSTSIKRTATDSALKEIMQDVIEFRNNGLKEEEVAVTKSSLLNSEALRYESPNQKAGFLSQIIRYNLPKDYTAMQSQVLKGMTQSEMNELAKKYITPDKMVILVVGNKYLIKDKLEKLGYGKVKEIEVD